MSFNRPPPRTKQYEGANPSAPRAPLPVVVRVRLDENRVNWITDPQPVPKTSDRKSQAIRDSARGEDCTVRIVGACMHDPEATIWSHAPLGAAGKGRSIKALDICGAYACTACDAVIDGQRHLPPGATRESVLADWMLGHMRSLVRLRQKGLV